jgi:hypothetical protein
MKFLSKKKALQKLADVRDDLRHRTAQYEQRAKNCLTCQTPGACCLDEHFVNVHISRLETIAISNSLSQLPNAISSKVHKRIHAAVDKYGLTSDGDTYARTYACPLFEKGVGCLVHNGGKPVPCILHACYERKEDLPPEQIQVEAEEKIAGINRRTFGRELPLLPLPVALSQIKPFDEAESPSQNPPAETPQPARSIRS